MRPLNARGLCTLMYELAADAEQWPHPSGGVEGDNGEGGTLGTPDVVIEPSGDVVGLINDTPEKGVSGVPTR